MLFELSRHHRMQAGYRMNDNELFTQVAKELAAGHKDEGLWLKAFASENGDEAKTKAHYVRLRVELLKSLDTPPNSPPNSTASLGSKSSSSGRWIKILFLILVIAIPVVLVKSYVKPSAREQIEAPRTPKPLPAETTFDPFEEMRRAGVTVNTETSTITIDGEITSAAAKQFDYAVKLMPSKKVITVSLNSPGGDLYAAMAIGRAIRQVEQSVAVAVWEDAKCYSACVFVLAAGEQRIRRGSIGIHRPYSAVPSSDVRQSEQWFTKISTDSKTYLREMRVREALFDDMVSIAPSEILIFQSTSEMDRYGLIKMDPVVEERISATWMKKYGISDRSVLMQRKANADRACSNNFEFEGRKYTLQECFDAFLSGRLEIQ